MNAQAKWPKEFNPVYFTRSKIGGIYYYLDRRIGITYGPDRAYWSRGFSPIYFARAKLNGVYYYLDLRTGIVYGPRHKRWLPTPVGKK